MSKHRGDLPSHKRLCVDGVPHLRYFDPDTQIVFAWTGRFNDGIEVSRGEGPVTNVVRRTPRGDALAVFFTKKNDSRTVVHAFWGLCEMWLQSITAEVHPEEPEAVASGG